MGQPCKALAPGVGSVRSSLQCNIDQESGTLVKTVELDDIVTDNEVFVTRVLVAFTDCRSVLSWKATDTELQFFLGFLPRNPPALQITPENLDDLIQAQADVQEADPTVSPHWGAYLFYVRQLGSMDEYRFVPGKLRPLFEGLRTNEPESGH